MSKISLELNDFQGSTIEKSFQNDENYFEKAEGSRGGKIIGRTKSGKPIYATGANKLHSDFTPKEHKEAFDAHMKLSKDETLSHGQRKAHWTQALRHDEEMEKKKMKE